jgi:hypothetical protein
MEASCQGQLLSTPLPDKCHPHAFSRCRGCVLKYPGVNFRKARESVCAKAPRSGLTPGVTPRGIPG